MSTTGHHPSDAVAVLVVDTRHHQIDHHDPWHDHGSTKPANSNIACGYHNRPKETGFRPIRAPDGARTLIRPDNTPITPPA